MMTGYIEKTLMEGERVLHRTRMHWIILSPALLGMLAALVVPMLLHEMQWGGIQVGGHTLFFWSMIGLLLFSALLAVFAYIEMQTSEYAVTNKRVIMKKGFICRVALDILLRKVESLKVRQGILGRIFHYGTIIVSGTGGSKDAFYKVCYPIEFRNAVQQQVDDVLKGNEKDE